MSLAKQLIEAVVEPEDIGITVRGWEIGRSAGRTYYAFETLAQRSGFEQDASAVGYSVNLLDGETADLVLSDNKVLDLDIRDMFIASIESPTE